MGWTGVCSDVKEFSEMGWGVTKEAQETAAALTKMIHWYWTVSTTVQQKLFFFGARLTRRGEVKQDWVSFLNTKGSKKRTRKLLREFLDAITSGILQCWRCFHLKPVMKWKDWKVFVEWLEIHPLVHFDPCQVCGLLGLYTLQMHSQALASPAKYMSWKWSYSLHLAAGYPEL